MLDVLADAAEDRDADPCLAKGAGWIAEEAPANALRFLLFRDEPVAALWAGRIEPGDELAVFGPLWD